MYENFVLSQVFYRDAPSLSLVIYVYLLKEHFSGQSFFFHVR